MTKNVALLLGAGLVAVVIGAVFLFREVIDGDGHGARLETRRVEIGAPRGTQVYAKLPGENEQHLGDLVDNSLAVDVPIGASVILRHQKKEKTLSSRYMGERKDSLAD